MSKPDLSNYNLTIEMIKDLNKDRKNRDEDVSLGFLMFVVFFLISGFFYKTLDEMDLMLLFAIILVSALMITVFLYIDWPKISFRLKYGMNKKRAEKLYENYKKDMELWREK